MANCECAGPVQLTFTEIGSLQKNFNSPLLPVGNHAGGVNWVISLSDRSRPHSSILLSLSRRNFVITQTLEKMLIRSCHMLEEYSRNTASSMPVRVASILPVDCVQIMPTSMDKPCCPQTLDSRMVTRLVSLIASMPTPFHHTSLMNTPYLSKIMKSAYTTNAILRPYFIRELYTQFPVELGGIYAGERVHELEGQVFNPDYFQDIFTLGELEWKMLKWSILGYMQEKEEGIENA
jgi:hypothetical protein